MTARPGALSDLATSGATWSGCHRFAARGVWAPRTVEELQDGVGTAGKVRALGSRHSLNDVADTTGALVSVQGLPARFELDDDAATVTVSAGSTYGQVAAGLGESRWALHNMGSLPHISVAGACATGTHGSGDGNRNLSSAVSAVEVVTADGELRRWTREDQADFGGRVLALGALGVVTAVTLDLVPTFDVRQDVWFDLPWSVLLDRLDEVMGAAFSVSVMPRWGDPDVAGKVWLKSRTDAWDPGLDPGRLGARWARAEEGELAEGQKPNQTVQGGVPGPWWQRLPHFRPDASPSRGDEIQTEYFVDRLCAADALRALREVADRFAHLVLVSELRSVAADDLWLSPTGGRDALGIHLTWRNAPGEVLEVLPVVERALAPFEPRPHWGKWFTLGAAEVAPSYPRLEEFRALAEAADPEHRFRNDYLRRVLGLPLG
ncbi:D-arabinono-1,4-lactone oxidase [Isoptericola sp. NPDC019482]|uniref:D-arabinono-1,4-lactone oxidase n=1 Tax=Isoptericola sp. NPDC019482 TaxID=3154688 RepID=UPI00347FF699